MKIINQYAKLVANKPILILIISLILTGIMFYGVTKLESSDMDYEDILPKGIEVIEAMNLVGDEFGGTENALIVIELSQSFPNSNEPTDIRDPRIINYINILTQKCQYIDEVEDISSISKIIKQLNNEHIPNSLSSIKTLLKNNPFASSYVSEDYSTSLIKIRLSENAINKAKEIEKQLAEVIDKTEKPAGVSVQLAGETIKDPIIERLIAPNMFRTSLISLIGILIVLLLLFRSLKTSFLPLTTILFGVIWAMGFVSLIGMGINAATSGVISMIMGIGIDFGIQIITRFKQELKKNEKRKAMEITINGIFMPMFITTLAALIGFRAMSLGQLKLMGEMGTIMSLGVAFCMLAAITIVPSILVLFEKDKKKK